MNSSLVKTHNEGGVLFVIVGSFIGCGEHQGRNVPHLLYASFQLCNGGDIAAKKFTLLHELILDEAQQSLI
jgi:hypothetical protein